MNVFGNPNHFPPILYHAWEYLSIKGPDKLETVWSQLAPPSFAETAHDNVKDTIKLGLAMGVLEERDSLLYPGSHLNGVVDYNSFRRSVRDLYFNQLLHPIEEEKSSAGNLQLASAWYFSFSVEESPRTWSEVQRHLERDYPGKRGDWPVPNPTQWGLFVRWMRFFGLVVATSRRNNEKLLGPLVNEVLEDTIETSLGDSDLQLDDFLSSLVSRMPSFPGGSISAHLPERARTRSPRNNALLATALQQKVSEGLIELTRSPDSPNRQVFVGTSREFAYDFIRRGNGK